MGNGSAVQHRKATVGPTTQSTGDLVRPGLDDNSSWEQILAILEQKGFEPSFGSGAETDTYKPL
jgi:hypothetical protein